MKSFIRRPKTYGEIKSSIVVDEEFEIPLRAKRRPHNLPSSWDDQFVHESKSWKRARLKKQWQKNARG